MKKLLLLAIFLLALSCTERSDLKRIDAVLDSEVAYEKRFRAQIDSITHLYHGAESDTSRFLLIWELAERYKTYNIDTCLLYSQRMQELASDKRDSIIAQSAMVYALASQGKEEEALRIYHSLPSDFPYDDGLRIYYESAHHLFLVISELHHEKRDSCSRMRHLIRRQLLQRDSTSYFALTYLFHEKRHFKQDEEAIRIMETLLAMDGVPIRYRAINEYNLGRVLMKTGRPDEALGHYAQAALLDLTTATKEYNSLYSLALYLHSQNDNERACRYIIRTMNDAVFCNYKSHYIRSAESANLIYSAFRKEAEARFKQQIGLIVLLALLFSLMTLLYVLHRIYSAKERKTHEKIRHINARLEDGNRIRDNILSDYMEKSARYIRKIDEMKSEMRRTYRSEGEEALLRMLRSPGYSDVEFKHYLQEFDEGILHLFPDFVEQVNELMSPEHPFDFNKNGSFCTELRILAIIRMGITDSKKIAKALNISVGTTYSYRYQMRHNARCPAKEFEGKIQNIGL